MTPRWEALADGELLDLRFRDLKLRIEGGPLEPRLERLGSELRSRGLPVPHAWFSSDWFSPDGVPGIALPFYLGHSRLVALERRQCLHAEGSTATDCMRLLRHEAGHAIDTAFDLHRRPEWRASFGRRSAPYLRHYAVDPLDDAYVHHLPRWYAQSHPAEDFAETFAVWLSAGSLWRGRYAGTPALGKLELVDRLMKEVAGRRPAIRSRERTESVERLDQTLADHYRKKRLRLRREAPPPLAPRIVKILGPAAEPGLRSPAATFLEKNRAHIVKRAAARSDAERYSIEQVLDGMIQHAREEGLRLAAGEPSPTLLVRTIRDTLDRLRSGRHRVPR